MWLRIVLAVSLGLNLAVIGLVAGIIVRFDGGPPPGRGAEFALPYMRALAPEDRRAIIRSVRREQGRPMLRGAERQARYADVIEALRAQPFDRAALDAVVTEQARGAVALQSAAQAAWLDRVSAMDDAARARYADRVAEQAARRGEGKKRPRPPGG